MISYEKFTLDNGLRCVVHTDESSSMAVFNILYGVGARDEHPEQTGFAHLFEHLMFAGSKHIPSYDEVVQVAGGENNAYTTNDITNYYIQLPKENLSSAFWLESDRMRFLNINAKSLAIQQKVVIEEFKEHYLNKPYGDAWMHLRALAYVQHPYRWMTIGKNIAHISDATLEDVQSFYERYYQPSNAVLCVAGHVTLDEVRTLAEQWFGDIPNAEPKSRVLPSEPEQLAARHQVVQAGVPYDGIWKAYHIPPRLQTGYYVADLISDILGSGKSSRLYQALVKDKQLFSNINCYHTGSVDTGLLVIEGKVVQGVAIEEADKAIEDIITQLQTEGISQGELAKIKNRVESMIVFEDMNLMARANNLAFFEWLGDAGLMNEELAAYQSVTVADMNLGFKNYLAAHKCNTLYYKSEKDIKQ